MIELIYDGNLGNNLFQYCFARILAETMGYRLVASPIPGFPRTFDFVDGACYQDAEMVVLRGQKPTLEFLHEPNRKYHILVTGYFQRYEYYREHRDKIKEWLVLEENLSDIKFVNTSDIVVGIRRGRDYIPRHGLPLSYYEEALSLVKFDRVFICTNLPSDPFVRHLQKRYDATIRPPGALDNLLFIQKFNKVIISNSTFLWWAAFLSNATEIVFPRPANGFWSTRDILSLNIALEIDEPRYKYLDSEEYHSEFFGEQLMNYKDRFNERTRRLLKQFLPFLRKQPSLHEERYIFTENFRNQ